MKMLLSLCAVVLTAAEAVNVNFNSCSGDASQGTGMCGVKTLARYVEDEFPPFDDLDKTTDVLTGFMPKVFAAICSTKIIKDNGIDCVEIRDAWPNVWTNQHFPGPGLQNGWYHLATAFVNTLRKQSNLYTYPISRRIPNQFVYTNANTFVVGSPATEPAVATLKTVKYKVCVIQSWGDTPHLKSSYDFLEYVDVQDETTQYQYLDNAAAQRAGTAAAAPYCDLVWTGHTHAMSIKDTSDGAGGKKYGFFHGPSASAVLDYVDPRHEDSVALMLYKPNSCLRDLVNSALEEIQADTAKSAQAVIDIEAGGQLDSSFGFNKVSGWKK